jgi:hypothetical protein
MAKRPLLVFPTVQKISPPKGKGFPPSKPHMPDHARQVGRLAPQFTEIEADFSRYKASMQSTVHGFEPETVLVIEIVGRVEDFKQALDATQGLEWLGEWDIDAIDPDDDFYDMDKDGKKIERLLTDRLFLSLGNERGLRELLALWAKWQRNESLPAGKTKWRDVFAQTRTIRRWGLAETLVETGMIDRWRSELDDPDNFPNHIHCQIELFYRQNATRRKINEGVIAAMLDEIGGRTLGVFIDMPAIGFHAVKAQLPALGVRKLLDRLDTPDTDIDIALFQFAGVMYFRPTGQSMTSSAMGDGEAFAFPESVATLSPVAAILDGAPNLLHSALKDRLLFDDPDNLAAQYQAGERKHGTSIASLVVHGELGEQTSTPLARKVYHLAVMQPDPATRGWRGQSAQEYFPDEVFFEDRIERAVRRMFEGEALTPPQAPTVKIINISLGDPARPLIHLSSPWAKLLDWLSWKYRVLFCVSAGNFSDDIDIGLPHGQFSAMNDADKVSHMLKCVEQQLSARRLLSPAESFNALTIGALHSDASGEYHAGQRIDLMPNTLLFSLASRLGHGFRRAIKPEILFPGGRQLYQVPMQNASTQYRIDGSHRKPGQQVAYDSAEGDAANHTIHTRGTSNATALATRAGARIYDALENLQAEHGEEIRDDLISVVIKALLVHGAKHDETNTQVISAALKTTANSRQFKSVMARYVGYGAVDIERVLACTEQRGTIIGCNEIKENEVHQYRFPLPIGLSESKVWRRMTITLAWLSPINAAHRNLREAKLEMQPGTKWDASPLKLKRMDTDHNQVQKGTVQHEVLESSGQIGFYQEDGHILLQVTCKPDATEKLDQSIPYAIAVTLEVAEGVAIPIYAQIRAQIRAQIKSKVPVGAAAM